MESVRVCLYGAANGVLYLALLSLFFNDVAPCVKLCHFLIVATILALLTWLTFGLLSVAGIAYSPEIIF